METCNKIYHFFSIIETITFLKEQRKKGRVNTSSWEDMIISILRHFYSWFYKIESNKL